jgi:glutathione synthase
MRIGFVVNAVGTEEHVYTTTRLGLAATRRGHEVWFMGVGDFTYNIDGSLSARARRTASSRYQGTKTFLAALQGDAAIQEDIVLDELDVLLLRNDPASDAVDRPWAQASGILFGQLAVTRGVMVLNDPSSLANAINKTYFQQFPEGVRPATVITRAAEEVRAFVKERGRAVIKPLQGSGGQGVFLVDPEDGSNLNQIIEATSRDGYMVVQEYLPQATEGDVRLFVMNGQPLQCEGKYAAFRRYNSSEDIRSNMHVGGKVRRVKVDDQMLELVEMVRPKLVQDGMFLVGLDIVGDKLMEVNVFSPGGLGSVQTLEKVDFAGTVIEALERKVHYRAVYAASPLSNLEVATL